MSHPTSRDSGSPKSFKGRLDHYLVELNAFLLVIAIGLAVMDGTCFLALQLRNLPFSQYFHVQRIAYSPAPTEMR